MSPEVVTRMYNIFITMAYSIDPFLSTLGAFRIKLLGVTDAWP